MKKIFLAMLLVAAITAVAQTTSAPAPAPSTPAPATPAPAAAPQQKKEIKDPAEYNAYMGAFGQQDPSAKVSGFEAFVTQYPNSVMKEEALEQLMGAYQQTNNVPKMVETAQKVAQIDPNNLKALVLLVVGKREAEEKTVSVRRLGSQRQEVMPLAAAVNTLVGEAVPPDLRRERKPA